MESFGAKMKRLLDMITIPFRSLMNLFDGEDLLFYLGVASIGYGLRQISIPYSWIIIGMILIFHAYFARIRETLLSWIERGKR